MIGPSPVSAAAMRWMVGSHTTVWGSISNHVTNTSSAIPAESHDYKHDQQMRKKLKQFCGNIIDASVIIV